MFVLYTLQSEFFDLAVTSAVSGCDVLCHDIWHRHPVWEGVGGVGVRDVAMCLTLAAELAFLQGFPDH